jgi:putative transposase
VRQAAYRGLFKTHLEAERIDEIRLAWQTGTPLGNDRFGIQIERTLKISEEHSKRGQLRKAHDNTD